MPQRIPGNPSDEAMEKRNLAVRLQLLQLKYECRLLVQIYDYGASKEDPSFNTTNDGGIKKTTWIDS